MIITKETLVTELARAEHNVARLDNEYHVALGVASAFRALLAKIDQPEPKPEAPAATEKPAP